MANICLNSYAFFGEPKMLQKFYDDMKEATKKEPKFLDSLEHPENYRPWALISLYYAAGFTDEEIKENHFKLRYEFCNIDWGEGEDGTPCIWLDIETAWSPNNEDVEILIERYPGIQMVCSAEEVGRDVFLNTDESGNFFPCRYYLSWCFDGAEREDFEDGTEYVKSRREGLQVIANIAHTSVKEVEEFYKEKDYPDVEDIDWGEYLNRHLPHDEKEGEEYHLNFQMFHNY